MLGGDNHGDMGLDQRLEEYAEVSTTPMVKKQPPPAGMTFSEFISFVQAKLIETN